MAMIALGLTTKEEISNGRYHGNSKVAKLIKNLERFRGAYFFRKGTNRKHLHAAIKVAFNRNIDMHYLEHLPAGSDFRSFMDIFVNMNFVFPAIVGLDFGQNIMFKHWVLAVGCEYHTDGSSSYLLLDPGRAPPRKGECWNAKLEIKPFGESLPYKLIPNQGEPSCVAIFDVLGLLPLR